MALSGSITFVDGQATQVDQQAGSGPCVTKELREGWAIEDVVAEAMGSSLSGLLAHSILDASRSLPSGPTAQPLGAMVSQDSEDNCKRMHQFIFFSIKPRALLDQHIGVKVCM
jgi:hypothetical protein